MADAAARVAVHFVDQLSDGLLAVADDMAGHPLGDRDQFTVDHQHAVVEAVEVALDNHHPGMFLGDGDGRPDLIGVHHADRYTAAVVGIERLDHHGIADALGGAHRALGVIHHVLLRYGETEVV